MMKLTDRFNNLKLNFGTLNQIGDRQVNDVGYDTYLQDRRNS